MTMLCLRRMLPLLAALSLVACGNVPKAAPAYAEFDFGPLDGREPHPLTFLIRNTEVVPAPWLASTGMQYRLLHNQPARRQYFVESRWAAQPAQMVEVAVKRFITSGESALAATGCRLRIDLDEFSQVFSSDSASQGVIEARAYLLAPRSDQVIAMRHFGIARPAPSANAVGGVAALRDSVGELNQQLLDWLNGLETGYRLPSRCGS